MQQPRIKFSLHVSEVIISETDALVEQLQSSAFDHRASWGVFVRLQALLQGINAIEQAAGTERLPDFLTVVRSELRRATWWERRKTSLIRFPAGDPNPYFFYETYGWRFVVVFDTIVGDGTVVDVQKVRDGNDRPLIVLQSLKAFTRLAPSSNEPWYVNVVRVLDAVRPTRIGMPGELISEIALLVLAFLLGIWSGIFALSLSPIEDFAARLAFFTKGASVAAGWLLRNFGYRVTDFVVNAGIGAGVMLVATCAFLALYSLAGLVGFGRYMAGIACPSARKLLPLSFKRSARGLRILMFLGLSWILRQGHYAITALALVIFILSDLRSKLSSDPLEVQRGGAMIVVAGLMSLLIGIWESRMTRRGWAALLEDAHVGKKEKLRDVMAEHIDRAQVAAGLYSALVSAVGTVIWGYGDQLVHCFHTPLLDWHVGGDDAVGCYRAVSAPAESFP